MATHLVWFRNDLRLNDHEPLLTACRAAAERSGDDVLPVYVIDPQSFGGTSFGFPRCGPHRLRFLYESLIDLDRQLRSLGSRLYLLAGPAADVLQALCSVLPVAGVYFHREVAPEEKATEQRVSDVVRNLGGEPRGCSPGTLCDWESLPFVIEEVPGLFTDFRRQVEKAARIGCPLPAPREIPSVVRRIDGALDIDALDRSEWFQSMQRDDSPLATMKFRGGESAGRERVAQYIWETDRLRHYKQTRNGMLRADDSSKFSPWLAHGCISAKAIFQEVRQYEQQRIKNDSTYWLKFELLWRDFFILMTAKHGGRLFQVGGLRGERLPWKRDWQCFEAWRAGQTGFPLIDANMRELASTGFMSNRGRQNVASFLTKNLGLDWRMGAEWFESMLIDFDPCSNYGNWNYAAGVGNDARGFRWFNTLKQAKDYDPHGEYVRHWLPELSRLPDESIHAPWQLSNDAQHQAAFAVGRDYPQPMVDLLDSAEHHRRIYEAARQERRAKDRGALLFEM